MTRVIRCVECYKLSRTQHSKLRVEYVFVIVMVCSVVIPLITGLSTA